MNPVSTPASTHRVITVHGIHSNGANSTDRIAYALNHRAGYSATEWDYCRTHALTAGSRARQMQLAQSLADQVMSDEQHAERPSLVAHSFGCLLSFRAMQAGARFDRVFLIAPAMDSFVDFPQEAANKIIIFSDWRDTAVRLGSLLPFHDFGDMGCRGYQGFEDPRVTTRRCHEWPGQWPYHGHYFNRQNLEATVQLIERYITHGD